MRYKVTDKKVEYKGGVRHYIQCDGSAWMWFPICQDDFDRINVGDEIELLITVIAPEPVAA